MTLTNDEIKEIAERAEKATPGPWFHGSDSCDCGGGYPCGHPDWAYEIYRQDDQPDPSWSEALKKMKTRSNGKFARYVAEILISTLEDRDFISHSRQDIPNLLAHIDAQAEALRIAREALEALHKERLEISDAMNDLDEDLYGYLGSELFGRVNNAIVKLPAPPEPKEGV